MDRHINTQKGSSVCTLWALGLGQHLLLRPWLGLKSFLQHEGFRCLSASQPAAALFLLG